jgi:hypothetical protein
MNDPLLTPSPAPTSAGTATAVGLTGVVVGLLLGWWLRGPAPVLVAHPVPEACVYDEDELKIVCLPYMRQTATTLQEAQTRVDALAVQVRTKEVEVEQLSAQVGRGREHSLELQRDLVAAISELDALRGALDTAREERERLVLELEFTRTQLDTTKSELVVRSREAEHARRDALEQRWQAFSSYAKLEVCEEGSEGKVDRCREVVEEALAPHESRFLECVRSNQAIPELRLRKTREQLPTTAALLDENNRITRGWYILFCDPDLPEAQDRTPPPAPQPRRDTPG